MVKKRPVYYGVICIKCRQGIGMFPDESGGKKPVRFEGPGKLRVTCLNCKTQHDYPTSAIVRLGAEGLN